MVCPKCDADGPFGETEEEAKERWDCRLNEPQLRDSDRIDELEEVIERILTMIEKLHERQSKR